jgi:ornithine cyclodeaminase/alanine dehydrogenase
VPAPELLYLTRAEVAELLPPLLEQVDLAERTYRAMADGGVEMPPKPGIHPRTDSFIHAMPAYLRDADVAAVKWVSGYPANPARGLPYISGLIVVNDAETGLPEAVLDAAEITAARTAAASGVCVRRWAPSGWRRAAILGYGEQGRRHHDVLRALRPEVEVETFDPRPEASTTADPRAAVEGADVVITAGPIVDAPDPPLTTDWLGERWLLLPIDFDFYVGAEPVAAADLFAVDDVPQFEHYRGAGHFAGWPEPRLSTGQALDREGGRVVVCNLGVGALDAAFAAAVVGRARAQGVGTLLPR